MGGSVTRRLVTAGVVALAALGLSSCSTSRSSKRAPAPTPTSAGPAVAPDVTGVLQEATTSPPEPAPAANPAAEAQLGRDLCLLIRRVQTSLSEQATPTEYVTEFTLALGDILVDHNKLLVFQAKGDELARKQCPAEHDKFLQQAKISFVNQPG